MPGHDVSAVELTADNFASYLRLDVAPEQQDFVAPNVWTFAQAQFEAGSIIRGIRAGDRPVGLLAMVDMGHPDADIDPGDPTDGAYLWRLMIAASEQGKGYGRATIGAAFDIARQWGRRQLLLSVVEGPGGPMGFYERLGFMKTGRIVDGEVELRAPVPHD